jgi:radical SAM superfamily enzyme YgiQ (UPF0313 family)
MRSPENPQKILLVKPHPRLATVLGLQRFMILEPLEFGYLAAAVPGHDVRVLDLRLYRNPLRVFEKALASFRPDVVGFTAYSHEANALKRLALEVRQKLPSATIIAGGHHATSAATDFNLEQIDAIVRGDGCDPFRALIDAISGGKELGGIENVLIPGPDFDFEAARGWPHASDPALMPTPRRDLWDRRSYYCVWPAEKLPSKASIFPDVAMMRSSWGCYMKCSFCVVPFLSQQTHRPRPVESVVDELESIEQEHVYFADDENFINKNFSWELAEAIEARGIKKRYFAWTRSTSIIRDMKLMEKWRDIGLDSVFIGFEFIDDKELMDSHKACSVATNERAFDSLRSIDVMVHPAFIIRSDYGEDDFDKLRSYVNALPPAECSFTVFTPIPGTADYADYEKRFIVDGNSAYDLHDCMHPLLEMKMPLRRFGELYGRQVLEGIRRTPSRVNRHLPPLKDLARVWRAEYSYHKGYKNLYRDYPREMWG